MEGLGRVGGWVDDNGGEARGGEAEKGEGGKGGRNTQFPDYFVGEVLM